MAPFFASPCIKCSDNLDTDISWHCIISAGLCIVCIEYLGESRTPAGFFLNPVSDPDDHPVRICFSQLFPMSSSKTN